MRWLSKQALAKSLPLICLGIMGVCQNAPCAEPDSFARVRMVNLVDPKAKIVAVLEPAGAPVPTENPQTALKHAPYSLLGDYVRVTGGRDYQLDVEGSAPDVGGFGAQQTLKLQAGRHYTLLMWGSVNVRMIDHQALFPFEHERLANVVLLAATKNDSDTLPSARRHFVFGDDNAGSGQFAFALQSNSSAGILRGYGGRANVLEAFQATAGKLPLRVAGGAEAVLARGELTLVAKATHFIVAIGNDKSPEVVFITDTATRRLEK